MGHPGTFRRTSGGCLIVVAILAAACVRHPPRSSTPTASVPAIPATRVDPSGPPAVEPDLPSEIPTVVTDLHLRLLEKETEIAALERELADRQRSLEAAIQEVVRAKSKLRSLESRAEAASALAEVEIALEVAAGGPSAGARPDLDQARGLLRSATAEFEAGNFGGALYLTGQARSLLQRAAEPVTSDQRLSPSEGELAFATPLELRTTARSNFRRAPAIDGAVIGILDPDTPVVGYSHAGPWIRVRVSDGRVGWIHGKLVEAR